LHWRWSLPSRSFYNTHSTTMAIKVLFFSFSFGFFIKQQFLMREEAFFELRLIAQGEVIHSNVLKGDSSDSRRLSDRDHHGQYSTRFSSAQQQSSVFCFPFSLLFTRPRCSPFCPCTISVVFLNYAPLLFLVLLFHIGIMIG
jgi:hypothetical protein